MDYRVIVSAHAEDYMAFYTIDEGAREVHIARVVYGRRNLEALL
jgi:plasmid stabilization system protein ParE